MAPEKFLLRKNILRIVSPYAPFEWNSSILKSALKSVEIKTIVSLTRTLLEH